MFLSAFTKRLTSGMILTLKNSAKRLYSGDACRRECPKSYPCVMEYPKRKCEEPECRPKEPCCPVAFSECSIAKDDSYTPRPDCCGSKILATDPCSAKGGRDQCKKKDLKLNRRILPPLSVWEYPTECCGNPCPDMIPRFDTIYYCPTDKAKRQYQKTWVECPAIQIRKRKVCCHDSSELPPMCKRKKEECPITACEFDSTKMRALCSLNATKKCARLTMPCCLRSRIPPHCRSPRGPSTCQKKCCPYPAFSECCQPCPQPRRKVECHCQIPPPQCVADRHLKRKLNYDLPPPLPAWPPKMIGPH